MFTQRFIFTDDMHNCAVCGHDVLHHRADDRLDTRCNYAGKIPCSCDVWVPKMPSRLEWVVRTGPDEGIGMFLAGIGASGPLWSSHALELFTTRSSAEHAAAESEGHVEVFDWRTMSSTGRALLRMPSLGFVGALR